MRSSILARIPGFRQRIIPEPRVPSQGSQAQGTRLIQNYRAAEAGYRRASFLWACSYDPAYRDVSLTDDLASYLFSYKILHCVHMRKRAGPLAEISFEFAEIIGRRDENFSI